MEFRSENLVQELPVFAHEGFYDHYAAFKHGYVHLTQPNTPEHLHLVPPARGDAFPSLLSCRDVIQTCDVSASPTPIHFMMRHKKK
jgi:hypothetical protein